MLTQTPLAQILLPALCAWALVLLLMRRRADGKWPFAPITNPDPIKRAWAELKWSTMSAGTILVLLLMELPATPVLSTFGYPANLQAVSQPQQLLSLLQGYDRALVRTTEVVYWLLFIFVWWFLMAIFSLSKAMSAPSREPGSSSPGFWETGGEAEQVTARIFRWPVEMFHKGLNPKRSPEH
jgi:hypothetical protein